MTDTDEHDEVGHLVEDAATRIRMVDKRQRKLGDLTTEIASPQIYGSEDATMTLVGWGSSYGAIYEAVDILRSKGIDVNALHFSEIWPFSSAAVEALNRAKHVFTVENNVTGQLAHLIRAETGKQVDGKILKYDGRPFTPGYIVQALGKELG